jgi:hypothetical protein
MIDLFHEDEVDLKTEEPPPLPLVGPPHKRQRLSLPSYPFDNLLAHNLDVAYILQIIAIFRFLLETHPDEILVATKLLLDDSKSKSFLYFLIKHASILGHVDCVDIEKEFLALLADGGSNKKNMYAFTHT